MNIDIDSIFANVGHKMIEIARVFRLLLIHYNHYKIKFVYSPSDKHTKTYYVIRTYAADTSGGRG